jgi:hypothetical protein
LACADQFIRTGELEHDDADNDEGTPSTPDGSQPDELSVSAEADGARRWHLPPRTDYTPLQTPPPSGPAAPADTPLSARAAAEAAAAAAAAAHAGHVHTVKQKEEDARREASVLTLFVRLFSGHRRLGGLVAEIVTQMERDEREYEVFRKVRAAYSHSRGVQYCAWPITAGVTLALDSPASDMALTAGKARVARVVLLRGTAASPRRTLRRSVGGLRPPARRPAGSAVRRCAEHKRH